MNEINEMSPGTLKAAWTQNRSALSNESFTLVQKQDTFKSHFSGKARLANTIPAAGSGK